MNSKRRRQNMGKHILSSEQRISEDEYNNIFSSDQIIKDCSFVDFEFIGKHDNKKCVWNACVSTAKGDYYDIISEKANDMMLRKYPLPDDFEFFHTKPVDSTGCHEMIFHDNGYNNEDVKYRVVCELEMINSGEIKIAANKIEIDESYQYGIGLHIRLNVDNINTQDIFNFVKDFLENGENEDVFSNQEQCTWNASELGVKTDETLTHLIWDKHLDIVTMNCDD